MIIFMNRLIINFFNSDLLNKFFLKRNKSKFMINFVIQLFSFLFKILDSDFTFYISLNFFIIFIFLLGTIVRSQERTEQNK